MIEFRTLGTADQSALWGWLHIALWDPPPAGLRPREVLHDPGVRIYAEDRGERRRRWRLLDEGAARRCWPGFDR
jgi:hypothetical protein